MKIGGAQFGRAVTEVNASELPEGEKLIAI
jgi:hypothetical protein